MSVYSCISIYFYILHIHVCIHTASWFVQILSLILPYKYRHISEYCSYWIWQDIYISVPIVIVRISAVLHQALIQPPVWSIFQLRFGCSFPGVQYTMTTETLVSKAQKKPGWPKDRSGRGHIRAPAWSDHSHSSRHNPLFTATVYTGLRGRRVDINPDVYTHTITTKPSLRLPFLQMHNWMRSFHCSLWGSLCMLSCILHQK